MSARQPHYAERITHADGGPIALELAPSAAAWRSPDRSAPYCGTCYHPYYPPAMRDQESRRAELAPRVRNRPCAWCVCPNHADARTMELLPIL